MTNDTNNQLRGICQCCGREQAVLRGRMSKHGYTVEHGWFRGVCSGDRHEPMQENRDVTDRIIAEVLDDCLKLDQLAADLKAGKVTPNTVKLVSHRPGQPDTMPWADAADWQRSREIERRIYNTESRAKHGRHFATDMGNLADAFHGKALKEVAKADKPDAIVCGEVRVLSTGSKANVTDIRKARVYWKTEAGVRGWTGTQAWRKLAKA